MDASPVSWEEELEHWLEPFRALLSRPAQKQRMAVYLKGLVLPGERKSLEPMAARVAPGDLQQLHHFLSTSPWPAWRLEDELIRQADALLGGPEALLKDPGITVVEVARRLGVVPSTTLLHGSVRLALEEHRRHNRFDKAPGVVHQDRAGVGRDRDHGCRRMALVLAVREVTAWASGPAQCVCTS